MRRIRGLLVLLAGATLGVFLLAAPAFGTGSITSPAVPIQVPGDSNGNPLPFNMAFTGMPASVPILAEMCDGVSPATQGYTVSQHCDPTTSLTPVIASPSGGGTFDNDIGGSQTGFVPTKGALVGFNCLGPNDTDLSNGQPNFHNCQVKLSTSNGQDTSDQVFATLVLPDSHGDVPEVPYAVILPIGAIGLGAAYFVIRKRRTAWTAA